MTRRYAVLTLGVSAVFLMAVGVLLNSQQLFFMSTMMMVTLIGLRVQASLATRGLRFERVAPTVIVAGELVAIRIRVWSLIRLRRPLLIITDELPDALVHEMDVRPLPVAPNYEEAVETRYELRPLRRGIYRWSKIRVRSTDSLGILSVERIYEAEPIEVVIHPAKVPFSLDMVSLSGWGMSQADQGRNRGPGLEPRGVREFLPGDSVRFVHWRTTARTGTLHVKEFETGFNTNLILALQLTDGSEAGTGAATTLEAMCGHAAYLTDVMLTRGSAVSIPALEGALVHASEAAMRNRQICDALAGARADRQHPFASELEEIARTAPPNSTIVVMLAAAEPGIAEAVRHIAASSEVIALLYDPSHFPGKPPDRRMIPATDPDFMASISVPNVAMRVMESPYGRD
ncbi:MAG: DUF58 domain-containing protein [Armatimonadetes bacterium]|nr:DUF58 domain-containing protein [Armatimonadota bacterium]